MKKLYILFIVFFYTICYAQSQNRDEISIVFQKGDSSAISDYFQKTIGFDWINARKLEKRDDTLSAINQIVSILSLNYLDNNLEGLSDYKKFTEHNVRIFLQPEVEIAIFPQFDYRQIFSEKYDRPCNYVDTKSNKKGVYSGYVSKYSFIPNLKNAGNRNYYLFRTKDWNNQDFNRLIKIDTIHLKTIQNELNKDTNRSNINEIEKVIYIDPSQKEKQKIYLRYNFVIDRIIFNPELDQALVQFSTFKSAYEFFFLRVGTDKRWELAIKRELAHIE